MPINLLDAHYESFQKQVVPICQARQIAVIGMKGLAGGKLPEALGIGRKPAVVSPRPSRSRHLYAASSHAKISCQDLRHGPAVQADQRTRNE